jgi:hypothetical protein
MAIRAYVLVESTRGRATQVAEALAKLPGVEMAHAVTGTYDVIALVEAASLSVLGELISQPGHVGQELWLAGERVLATALAPSRWCCTRPPWPSSPGRSIIGTSKWSRTRPTCWAPSGPPVFTTPRSRRIGPLSGSEPLWGRPRRDRPDRTPSCPNPRVPRGPARA